MSIDESDAEVCEICEETHTVDQLNDRQICEQCNADYCNDERKGFVKLTVNEYDLMKSVIKDLQIGISEMTKENQNLIDRCAKKDSEIDSMRSEIRALLLKSWDRGIDAQDFRVECRLAAQEWGYCVTCGVMHEGWCDEQE